MGCTNILLVYRYYQRLCGSSFQCISQHCLFYPPLHSAWTAPKGLHSSSGISAESHNKSFAFCVSISAYFANAFSLLYSGFRVERDLLCKEAWLCYDWLSTCKGILHLVITLMPHFSGLNSTGSTVTETHLWQVTGKASETEGTRIGFCQNVAIEYII